MSALATEEFDKEVRKSIKLQNSQFGNISHRVNNNAPQMKLYDDSCSRCTKNFENKDKLLVTACNHAFHEKCLKDWIEKRINAIYQ